MALERVRVASLQYFIRPVASFENFRDQVQALVETAADYKCHLLVFPEYFSVQLLTLGNLKRPIQEQIRDLAAQRDRIVEMFSQLSKSSGLYIVAGSIPTVDGEKTYNDSYFFAPSGSFEVQGKLHMTRFEKEEWKVSARKGLKVFDTEIGKIAVLICYDVEFPELARAAAKMGAQILIVPSCTDDRQGYLRVRICAHARAIENQVYVVHSSTVGSLPNVPAVSLNYGQASILTPSDFPFSRDGVLAEGIPNQETMVIGELNLKVLTDFLSTGTVLPLRDSESTGEALSRVESVSLR